MVLSLHVLGINKNVMPLQISVINVGLDTLGKGVCSIYFPFTCSQLVKYQQIFFCYFWYVNDFPLLGQWEADSSLRRSSCPNSVVPGRDWQTISGNCARTKQNSDNKLISFYCDSWGIWANYICQKEKEGSFCKSVFLKKLQFRYNLLFSNIHLIPCSFYILDFLAQNCSVLPISANPGYEKGCKGAVYYSGEPSEDYCKNIGDADGRYPWYQECCKWENEECLAKGLSFAD